VPQLSAVNFCYDKYDENRVGDKDSVGYPNAYVRIADQKTLNNTFNGCANLISLDLAPTDAESLVGTFVNCTGLKYVKLPLSLKSIDKQAFTGCKSMTGIIFDSGISEVNVNSLDGLATELTAENTLTNNDYKYRLTNDYTIGIRLSGSTYTDKTDIASEISAAVNALMNTKPFKYSSSTKTSRRIGLYLNDGSQLNLNNKWQVYNPLHNLTGTYLTSDIAFKTERIVGENEGPQC